MFEANRGGFIALLVANCAGAENSHLVQPGIMKFFKPSTLSGILDSLSNPKQKNLGRNFSHCGAGVQFPNLKSKVKEKNVHFCRQYISIKRSLWRHIGLSLR